MLLSVQLVMYYLHQHCILVAFQTHNLWSNLESLTGDELMADRGFTIEDLLTPLGVRLNIPPFLGDRDQMDGNEVVETQQIALLRIHIE